MITLTVNGETCRYEEPLTLQAFLERWSPGTRMVAVVNDEVISRQKVGDVILREGDRIELLSLAGGG
ncbi:MAG: sulfur carrier protein ThiS [Kiritimatiellaeota bacterium]|nr:sulfur carrier protein ThiS [Kiritimatiellota bacterium]